MVLELVLTLPNAEGRTLAHLDHVIRMFLAEPSLFPLHAWNVITVHSRIGSRTQLEFAQEPVRYEKRYETSSQCHPLERKFSRSDLGDLPPCG